MARKQPFHLGLVERSSQNLPRRHHPLRVGQRVIHPEFAGRCRRHFELSDLQLDDTRLAATHLSAAVGAADNDGAGLLRHPKRLQTERRHDLAVGLAADMREQRRAADDAVAIADDRDEACPRRRLRQDRQGHDRAAKTGEGIVDRRAEHCDPRFLLRPDRIGIAGQEEAGNRRGRGKRAREQHVVVGHPGDAVETSPRIGAGRQHLSDSCGRSAVAFREHDIEGDRRRAGISKRLSQPRHVGTRPWPLAKPPQCFVVDIDDANRGGLVLAGIGTLVCVEQQVAELTYRRHLCDVQCQQDQRQDDAGQSQQQPPRCKRLEPPPQRGC